MILAPLTTSISDCLVVCFPLSVFLERPPVSCDSVPVSMLSKLDFPTADCPARHAVFPFVFSKILSLLSFVFALVAITSNTSR